MLPTDKNIKIGTSNIVVPGNKGTFPDPYHLKSRLHYYATLFNSLEVNQTFYKIPKPSTFERWAAEVEDDFEFSVKLSKEITHHKTLKGDPDITERFLYAAERLADRKGCLLLQFPGKITLEYFNEVEAILQKVDEAGGGQWKKAVELRDRNWHTGETYELLNEHKATLVLHDMPKSRLMEDVTDAPFVYLRFHGQQGDYKGGYPDDLLQQAADNIMEWSRKGKAVYAYFNNTIGDAFDNARTLSRMVDVNRGI